MAHEHGPSSPNNFPSDSKRQFPLFGAALIGCAVPPDTPPTPTPTDTETPIDPPLQYTDPSSNPMSEVVKRFAQGNVERQRSLTALDAAIQQHGQSLPAINAFMMEGTVTYNPTPENHFTS